MIWDFRVFTQIYVLQKAGGITRDTNLLGVFAYRISIGENRFDIGAAVAVVMVLITILLTMVYLRAMVQAGGAVMVRRATRRCEARPGSTPPVWWSPCIALFPVYWMVLTSFKRNSEVRTLTPSFLPRTPTLEQLPQGLRAGLLLDGDAQQRDGHGDRRRAGAARSPSSPPSPCPGSASTAARRSSSPSS